MRSLVSASAVLAATLAVALVPAAAPLRPFWPAVTALGVIALSRQAVAGLAAGFAAGCLVLAGGNPLTALRSAVGDHLFPQLDGTWHVAALVFTLLLGAFAGLLEASGGFISLLERLLRGGRDARKRVLLAAYGLGLLCFFDGLANSMLIGRIARQAADRSGVSRERLAWVVDSTSSPVACVAFISTWIAFQISLIRDALPDADAYALYFRSIPANPYCLLTLLLVPLGIACDWQPGPMRRFSPSRGWENEPPLPSAAPWRVFVPLGVLALSIALGFQLWSDGPFDLLSLDAWRAAAGGNAGPFALTAGALAGLAAAWACFPEERRSDRSDAAFRGAAGLLPAVVVLVLAWCLGSVFTALHAGEAIRGILGGNVAVGWLPLAVFGVASLTSFATGTSWGTMGILMPLALQVLVGAGAAEPALTAAVIGAVFGGAVFGDHCSPFSDTTIVSALAAGCRPLDHVTTQLPYALTTAAAAAGVYGLFALGLPAWAATLILCAALVALISVLTRARKP